MKTNASFGEAAQVQRTSAPGSFRLGMLCVPCCSALSRCRSVTIFYLARRLERPSQNRTCRFPTSGSSTAPEEWHQVPHQDACPHLRRETAAQSIRFLATKKLYAGRGGRRARISKMLCVKFDGDPSFGMKQIDFHLPVGIEWNRQLGIEAELSGGFRQRFQPPVEKRLGGISPRSTVSGTVASRRRIKANGLIRRVSTESSLRLHFGPHRIVSIAADRDENATCLLPHQDLLAPAFFSD